MLIALVGWITFSSMVTAVLYALDKRRARDHEPRIAEKTLLLWCLVGGWLGGWLAGRRLRHKTRKTSYQLKFALAATVNLALIISFLWWFFHPSAS